MKNFPLLFARLGGVVLLGVLIASNALAQGGYTFTVNPPSKFKELMSLANAIGGYAQIVAIPIALIVVVYAGVKLLLARGNATQVTEAKQILWWGIVGIAIIAIGSGFIVLIKDIIGIQ